MIEKNRREEFNEEIKIIKKERLEEIIDRAYYNWETGRGSVVIYLDLYHSMLKAIQLEEDFYKGDDNFIELYCLPRNFLEYDIWNDYADLLTRDEYERLVEKFGDKADYRNKLQLSRIGIDYNERIREYLMYLEKQGITPWMNKEAKSNEERDI